MVLQYMDKETYRALAQARADKDECIRQVETAREFCDKMLKFFEDK